MIFSDSSGLRRPEGRFQYFNLAGTGSFELSRPTEKGVLVGSSVGIVTTGVVNGERCDSRPMLTEDVCSEEIVYRYLRRLALNEMVEEEQVKRR